MDNIQPDMRSKAVTVPVQGRLIAPDVLRVFAVWSVITIHFLLNNGFYEVPIEGVNMIIMLIMRVIVSPCVPLFIILTGYLSVYKPLTKSHYAKGMKVVWLYLLTMIPMVIYRVCIRHNMTLDKALWGILKFNDTAPYGWYIEMHIGLYLLIPFINILYKNIPSKRWKQILILSCFFLNSLPKIINVYNFVQTGWWNDPSSSTVYQRLMPQWWLFGYPLTYYLIGAYLREYGLSLGKVTRSLLYIVTIAATALYLLWRAPEGKFAWGPWIDWDSPLVMLSGTLLASLVLDCRFRRMPTWLMKTLGYLSGMSLQIFLLSYIFDQEYYPILKSMIPAVPDRLWSYFIIVPAIFLSSLAIAAVIDLLYRLFGILYRKLKQTIKPVPVEEKETEAQTELDGNNRTSKEENNGKIQENLTGDPDDTL